MKKLMNIMLALALTAGLATITVAQDAPKADSTKKAKKGKAKKSGDAKDGKDAAPKGKGKGKKAKDDKADTK